jgi:capsular exopolysaccharide synthesis family protein
MAEQNNVTYDKALVSKRSPFALSESFKTIRTNLLYTGKNEKCPVYAVTSSYSGSGKSVVIANLAQSFAQLGKKVVLVDCDLRRPTQQKVFGVQPTTGASEYLAGLEPNLENVIIHTFVENLDLLTSGRIPPNPAELLAGDNMDTLIAKLKEAYDVVFIDFPPATVVSDCVIPKHLITGYIFVVRSGYDNRPQLNAAIASMKKIDANIIGFVLNDVNLKTGGYFSKYRYGYKNTYSNGYGYYYGGNSKNK